MDPTVRLSTFETLRMRPTGGWGPELAWDTATLPPGAGPVIPNACPLGSLGGPLAWHPGYLVALAHSQAPSLPSLTASRGTGPCGQTGSWVPACRHVSLGGPVAYAPPITSTASLARFLRDRRVFCTW